MQIKAKISLSLPNQFYKITLRYDTFEKATYDSYLIASLISNAKNKEEIFEYINDITGKGSLNLHFINLYNKMKDFSSEQINSILNDSLYPVTVIDKKNHFKYYPMFNATRFNGKVYEGNLADDESLIRDLIMPKRQDCKFLSIKLDAEIGMVKPDVYNAIFSDEKIMVNLEDGKYWNISNDDFSTVYKNEVNDESISKYKGKIKSEIKDGSWSVLQNKVIDTLIGSKNYYFNNDGNHCTITDDYLKKTEIIKVFSLYFYKETLIKYETRNADICEETIRYLMDNKGINEFKTKSLITILKYVNENLSQEVINYVLGRKDSKEIAEIGLNLIKSGLEKGWNQETLMSIKKSSPSSEYKHLYRVNNDLGFEVSDLLDIDDADLTVDDKKIKKEFLDKKENIKKEMDSMIGDMTNSAVRNDMKKLPTKDSVYKKLNDFFNKYVGHRKKDASSLSMQTLIKEFDSVKSIYNNEYQNIKKRCDKLNDK